MSRLVQGGAHAAEVRAGFGEGIARARDLDLRGLRGVLLLASRRSAPSATACSSEAHPRGLHDRHDPLRQHQEVGLRLQELEEALLPLGAELRAVATGSSRHRAHREAGRPSRARSKQRCSERSPALERAARCASRWRGPAVICPRARSSVTRRWHAVGRHENSSHALRSAARTIACPGPATSAAVAGSTSAGSTSRRRPTDARPRAARS